MSCFVPERATNPLQNPGASCEIVVLIRSLPSPRRTCLKRLSGLHLPRFGIRVYLLPRYSRSALPYSVIFGTISRGCPARDFLHPPPGGRASAPLYPSAHYCTQNHGNVITYYKQLSVYFWRCRGKQKYKVRLWGRQFHLRLYDVRTW